MALRASRRLIEQPTNSQDVAIQQSQDGFWAVYKPLRSILAQMNTINKFIANASLDTYLQMHVQAYILTRFSIEYSVFEVLDKPDLDDESKAVCLAAQIYINKVYRTFEKHHMVPDRIAQRLKEPLLAVIQSHYENKEHCDLILWAAVLGGLGSRDKDLRRVFVFAISAVCISMGWTAWSEVLGQLNLWVWCKNCLEEECSELWSEVEEYIEDIRAPGLKVDFHGS